MHELLTESGLGHFYELSSAPGVRIRSVSAREQWTFLDDPALQPRLLDFTDGKVSKITFQVPAIHCVACVWLLENLFRLHPGVGRSQVNLPKREVAISFSTEKIKLSELVALLAAIGYEPVLTLDELEKRHPDPARRRRWLQVGIAGFAFGNIMLISLPQYLGLDSFSGPLFRLVFGYLSLALALPVVLYSAADYWKSAALSVRQRMLTLDVPIALGLAALYAQSAWEIASGRGEGYLDSLAGLVFFLLCGRGFQQVTHARLAFDRNYRSFFPLSVTRRVSPSRSHQGAEALTEEPEIRNPESGADRSLLTSATPHTLGEERISLSQLQVGDRVLIRNGELIPADAILVRGPALTDYSFVTGESEPVAKTAGAYLYAGGQQIGGAIEIETVKPVSQSYLASLWSHKTFQKHRDRSFETLTNRFSRHFTLAVLVVALGTAAFWLGSGDPARALRAFIAVLIVACPCALALAAPFTFGTAQRWLARAGVFLRNALVLERLSQVDTIVFDKTGTLTASSANAVSFEPGGSRHKEALSAESIIRNPESEIPESLPASTGAESGLSDLEGGWVRSLARHSTHPHAAQISQALAGRQEPEAVHSFVETPGCGIEGWVQGHAILLGSPKWLASRGVSERPAEGSRKATGEDGQTAPSSGSVVGVAIDGHYRGAFRLANPLRPEIAGLIRNLTGRYNLALLSGDHAKERERFRALFPDDAQLHFNQNPLEKLNFVERLQQSGKVVMMVGDGLNDAGALQQSDVGVAVIAQAGAFSPASDVILEVGRLPRLIEVLGLARRAVRIVRWSFGLSAVYNVAGVSVAAAGGLSPLVAAILMPLSSFSVVLFACGATSWAARRTGVTSDVQGDDSWLDP